MSHQIAQNGKTPVLANPDEVIRNLERSKKAIEEELAAARLYKAILLRMQRAASAASNGSKDGKLTVSDALERLLTDHSELHMDEMIKLLKERFQLEMNRKNLSNTLNRWLARGRRFKRVSQNTYALLIDGTE